MCENTGWAKRMQHQGKDEMANKSGQQGYNKMLTDADLNAINVRRGDLETLAETVISNRRALAW